MRRRWFESLPATGIVWLAVSVATVAQAGDWPQVLGLHRNGIAVGETLPESWPAAGPTRQWSYPLGMGYAGPAVVGKRVVVFHRVDDVDRVEAINLDTGRRIWKRDFDANYRGGINPDTGPRCVPLIHKSRVYLFGAAGDLHCVELEDGSHCWSRELLADYSGREGYFGAGSTPLVAGDKLLVNVGGQDGAGIVAVALDTGRTVWKSTEEGASYSSPTLAEVDGKTHAIFVTRLNTVSLDPNSGGQLFRFPFGKRGPTVNAATPLVFDKQLFVSASYGIGARLVKIEGRAARIVWSRDDAMSSQYTTCVYRNGFLFGTHGREDIGRASLRCIRASDGNVQWSKENFGVGHLILAGDKLLVLTIDGRLVLARADSDKFVQLASGQVSDQATRALPALSGGRLLLRSNQGDGGSLICLKMAAGP